MGKAMVILVVLALVTSVSAAEVYKWVDDKGVVHFTDDYNKIPQPYRGRAKAGEMPEAAPSPPPPAAAGAAPAARGQTPDQGEGEVTRDRFGLGEEYWRDRVRPAKERLKAATANYEAANRKYAEKSDELSQKRYGSPTQYKMSIAELDGLKDERDRYKAEMNEADESLKRLMKDAEESKANPEWLK